MKLIPINTTTHKNGTQPLYIPTNAIQPIKRKEIIRTTLGTPAATMLRNLSSDNPNYPKNSKVKLTTVVEGNPKAPFSIATTTRCRGGRHSFPRISPLYP